MREGPVPHPSVHWIDTSTVGPDAVRELAARLPEGVTLNDAPVMGSVDRAATGELWVLAGGELLPGPVRQVLDALGEVTACGPVGSGAALKLVMINAVVGGVGLDRRDPGAGWSPGPAARPGPSRTGQGALAGASAGSHPVVGGRGMPGFVPDGPLRWSRNDLRIAVHLADTLVA
ncbi:NAD(P)-binding domain-containing protein [Streptomyces sp. NPDC059355]|uniref:NAD(P)-binding domain-containing protein n=1 Tax=Streptomyces sp. NPDC059355 TaxID=3346811 RepID=UPI0036BB2196